MDSGVNAANPFGMGMGMPASMSAPSPQPVFANTTNLGGLADIFSGLGITSTVGTASFAPPKQSWLSAQKGKGLEVTGTFSRRNGIINIDMDFTNKAMQAMSGFAIQLNKNSFGLVCGANIQIPVLQPGQTAPVSLPLNTNGPVMKMTPISNLQVGFSGLIN